MNGSRIQVLNHQQIRVVALVFYFNLVLARFFHPTRKHGSKMLALSAKEGLMGVDWFSFDNKNHVAELGVIDYFAHICNQRVHSFIVDLIFFKFAYVEDADVV